MTAHKRTASAPSAPVAEQTENKQQTEPAKDASTTSNDPFVIFKDLFGYVTSKYKMLKVNELEMALGWMLVEMDADIQKLSPGTDTKSVYDVMDQTLYVNKGSTNTVLRIMADAMMINAAIKKQEAENKAKEDDGKSKEKKP